MGGLGASQLSPCAPGALAVPREVSAALLGEGGQPRAQSGMAAPLSAALAFVS